MIEIEKTSLSDFAMALPENLIKKIVWDGYMKRKQNTEEIPKMKNRGYFMAVLCIMAEYGRCFQDPRLVILSDCYVGLIFQNADPKLLMDEFVVDLQREELELEIWDYEKTLDYFKKQYGKWLAGMEFSAGEKDTIYGRMPLKKEYTKQPDMTVRADLITYFTDLQNSLLDETNQYLDYGEKELYEACRRINGIKCGTVSITKRREELEKIYHMKKEEEWKNKLSLFQSRTREDLTFCPKVFYGDNAEKVRQVWNFMSAGRFEFVYFGNDTTRRGTGKTGMVITTEAVYYKTTLSVGEIPVREITHFSYEGKMFGQALIANTIKKKKIALPVDIPDSECLKYIKVLEELLKIIRG